MGATEDLLHRVVDRDSFIAFVEALIKDREEAEKLERANPDDYRYDGAKGWRNTDISAFLECGMQSIVNSPPNEPATWKTFADFLFYGKIYE